MVNSQVSRRQKTSTPQRRASAWAGVPSPLLDECVKVANELRARIESGQLPPDARVPSITTLMQEYGIARNTARHALAVLAEDGLIEITPGWGSFVKPAS
jgi:GntR family transcriptional regulator